MDLILFLLTHTSNDTFYHQMAASHHPVPDSCFFLFFFLSCSAHQFWMVSDYKICVYPWGWHSCSRCRRFGRMSRCLPYDWFKFGPWLCPKQKALLLQLSKQQNILRITDEIQGGLVRGIAVQILGGVKACEWHVHQITHKIDLMNDLYSQCARKCWKVLL